MPTYEYACSACGHRLEVVQRFTDDPLTVCGECGGALRRVFHPVGVVLKGSGFYATDNRSGKALQQSSEKKEPSTKPSSGSSTTSTPSTKTGSDA